MNIAKNMEAIFLTTLALGLFTGYAQADTKPVEETFAHTAIVSIDEVQTVTVSAKRLTAAEKAAFN
ncbi:MAG TPA: hypothetical protein VIT92_16560 [Burkholderiaceae bacterium]